MRGFLVCMTAMVMFCGSVAAVRADDLVPPPWQRGGPGTTYQDWTFPTNAGGGGSAYIPATSEANPYGTRRFTIGVMTFGPLPSPSSPPPSRATG